ncbi:MAG: DEAD/SNF2-like helicase [Hyperionvirus sp.]|uniref:DEAD/SNF2-like helicase n=1 Tax=Hyperionvirus sp. TaxID=2487770 RepID=A0A3G5AA55_9VIRU|nr:MAG: DEAD/SNF2-like helicase [Hyperionvirus sp.]
MSVEMSEKKLFRYIRKNVKSSFEAHVGGDGKLVNNIANRGMKEGDIAVRGGKEYTGFSIRALEEIKPLLTDLRVSRAVKFLSKGDIQSGIAVLQIVDEVRENGLGLLYGVLKMWLELNEIPVPTEYINKAMVIKSKELLQWIDSVAWSPVLGKFEIVDIGFGKYGSVVPESWMGKVFPNADVLHAKMDKLDWRKGRPPVNFCCIYAMNIKRIKTWDSILQGEEYLSVNVKVGVSMFVAKGKLISDVAFFSKKKEYQEWFGSLPKNAKVFSAPIITTDASERLLIACDLDSIVISNPKYDRTKNVGLLVSTLQKLNRRGRGCSKVLVETLTELWKSPGYNLPEQQFLRVNACRQLAWRLYITTIEDAQPFINGPLSMLDIACLAILANAYPDIQFSEVIFKDLLHTALLIQHNDEPGTKWELLASHPKAMMDELAMDPRHIKTDDPFLKSLKGLLFYMPARQFDNYMLTASFNYVNNGYFKLKELPDLSMEELLSYGNKKEGHAGILAGFDMHPYPNLLLLLQSSLAFVPYDDQKHTTHALSRFVWDYSSGVNVRVQPPVLPDKESEEMLQVLTNIQESLVNPEYYKKQLNSFVKKFELLDLGSTEADKIVRVSKKSISERDRRLGFLLLFGQRLTVSHKEKRYEIIVAGTVEMPCKVKVTKKTESSYLEGEERYKGEMAYVDFLNDNKVIIDSPFPPIGYSWIWGDKKKIQLNCKIDEKKSDASEFRNKLIFYVDEYEMEPFDATTILIPLPKLMTEKSPDEIELIIKQMLYMVPASNKPINDYMLNLAIRKMDRFPSYEWLSVAKKCPIESNVWKSVYVKLVNNYNNEVHVGPIDGHGNKLQNAIDYLFEGTTWRIFNLLSMLYPHTVINTVATKSLKFKIENRTSEYMNLIDNLKTLSFAQGNRVKDEEKSGPSKITITTKLWEHQQKTSDKILNDMIHLGKRGAGDASNVGAGKTLTCLSILSGLYNHNKKRTDKVNNSGFLVLLPTTYLYKTWEDEIVKHTKGFNLIYQSANGSLYYPDSEEKPVIHDNSILVTTLGRMRDHPISHSWIFVTIDECLSVQNKGALQTGEALRQIISSQFGCLLMSATFFRSRFDKLFFLLKMLDTGLPETKNYLDAILAESIVSYMPTKTRDWKITKHAFTLSKSIQKEYNEIQKQNLSSERLFSKLQSFLQENFDYVSAYKQLIKNSEKNGHRCLLYAPSKALADELGEKINNLSRFPDISGQHVVLSFTEGTYGLNVLVFLDTIITQVPAPDRVPQMRGRLDRPNQKASELYLKYLYIEKTIDEASLFRLELANNFRNHYIMPLSEFYELAVGKKKKGEFKHGGALDEMKSDNCLANLMETF